ncbi:MerR family transcriptional regulator [Chungangia koreensis]|uniref:MerR family transcriptional regulator n=1 Tax=Chungangia koreensis TaxID=752657 RepID=A0ABV8X2H2_9LACT
MFNDHERSYTIQQVSEMTGLSKQVIRKWEDRYGIIRPDRLENGYRVYSQDEVKLLKDITSFVNAGYTIKQAAQMAQNQTISNRTPIESDFTTYINSLEEAGQQLDDIKLLQLLQQAQYTYGMELLIQDILLPFLKRIGQLWCDHRWGEFQEAVSSQTIRDYLAQARRSIIVSEHAPLVVGSCLPREQHEIPMQILLLQFRIRGYRTLMIGPSPATTAIQSTVERTNPEIVLLTATTSFPFNDGGVFLKDLDDFASKHRQTKFFIGGTAAREQLNLMNLSSIQFADNIDRVLTSASS